MRVEIRVVLKDEDGNTKIENVAHISDITECDMGKTLTNVEEHTVKAVKMMRGIATGVDEEV